MITKRSSSHFVHLVRALQRSLLKVIMIIITCSHPIRAIPMVYCNLASCSRQMAWPVMCRHSASLQRLLRSFKLCKDLAKLVVHQWLPLPVALGHWLVCLYMLCLHSNHLVTACE